MSQAQQEAILRGKQLTVREFIYNIETGEFLGRTGISWLQIGAFYVVFYAFLAGFLAVMMVIFYSTLDTKHLPKYQPGDGSSILRNSALAFRPLPRPKKGVFSTLIWYNTRNEDDIKHWVNSLNEFIKPYEGTGNVGQTSDVMDCSETNTPSAGQVCKFDYQRLGNDCTKAEGWGYVRRSPCIILKMNRMIGWKPEVYANLEDLPKSMPDHLKDHIRNRTEGNHGKVPKMVWVSCEGINSYDEEYIGYIEYTPWHGFPAYYFPYMNTPGYLSPIVAVRFVAPTSNVIINIECRAYAKNIVHNRKDRLGLTHFGLLQD